MQRCINLGLSGGNFTRPSSLWITENASSSRQWDALACDGANHMPRKRGHLSSASYVSCSTIHRKMDAGARVMCDAQITLESLKRAVVSQREEAGRFLAATSLSALALIAAVDPALARPEGVNKPELLPTDFTTVIDVAGFLSAGQEQRIARDLVRLEKDTGYKLRVLAQNYPETPGLAIKDYWGVDDNTVVFVADPSMGNILNFNVGATVDLSVPRSFWSRLAGKYGTIFYWREKGEDASIEAAVLAIDACLREEPGPRQCSEIR